MVMNILFALFSLYTSLIMQLSFAEEVALTSLSAHSVDYDGKKIKLGGGVNIDHRFGIISCVKAVIMFQDKEADKKELSPDRMILNGDVKIELRDGSNLSADEADINCLDLEGVFIANSPNKVVYITHIEEEKSKIPVKATAAAMRLKMKKTDGKNGSEYTFSNIQGEDAVTIEYNNPIKEGKK